MEGHVKAVALIYIVLGFLAVIAAIAMFGILAGAGVISGDRTAMLTTGIIGTVLAAALVIMSVPSIIAGFGLLKMKNWARVLTIILDALNLFGFPIGTAIGVYTLWVLLNDQTTRLFMTPQASASVVYR
jgi:hypothetical protein